MTPLEIGICSWSIDRDDPVRALHVAAQEFNVRVVQVGFFGKSSLDRVTAESIRVATSEAGVEISAAFVAFDNEDYSSIDAVRKTCGFIPSEHFKDRLTQASRAAALTASLRLNKLALHLGPIPENPADPLYAALLDRVRRLTDAVAHYGVTILAESGAESAETLDRFLDDLSRDAVGVNFDAGNFITYGTGDPVRAVATLSQRIRHVHLKDYVPSSAPGQQWGADTPLGAGQADIPRVISKLRAKGYTGPLVLERRAREGDYQPIREDLAYLRSMFQ